MWFMRELRSGRQVPPLRQGRIAQGSLGGWREDLIEEGTRYSHRDPPKPAGQVQVEASEVQVPPLWHWQPISICCKMRFLHEYLL